VVHPHVLRNNSNPLFTNVTRNQKKHSWLGVQGSRGPDVQDCPRVDANQRPLLLAVLHFPSDVSTDETTNMEFSNFTQKENREHF